MVLGSVLKKKIDLHNIFNRLTKVDEVELTENRQYGRIQILLLGTASIFLANITAFVVIISSELFLFEDLMSIHRNLLQTQENGKSIHLSWFYKDRVD